MIDMTYRRSITIILFCVLSFCLAVFIWLFVLNLPPESSPAVPVEIVIERGMSARDISLLLEERGIIRSSRYFRVYSKLTGRSRSFKAGKHPVDKPMTMTAIVRLLTTNPPVPPDIRVTVIEGLNIPETASVLAEKAGIDSARFVTLAGDSALARTLGVDKNSLEGYLYPDTYFVRPGTEPENMIRRMVAHFHEVFADTLEDRASELGMTVSEVVTLASIIECEVTIDRERPIVSSVFHRRLARNRPLEANPTIQYALGEKRRILYEDLTIDSPYNTYIHSGLPPGPIASPGRKSILAALYPVDTSFLYFVADGNGGHIFSKTIGEHKKAVREYRKTMRKARAQRSR